MTDTLIVNVDSRAFVDAAQAAFARHELVALQSFDLRSALSIHNNCECPHHGTAHCTCQFMVWLIYGNTREPVVLTVHSYDNRTEACIVQDATTIPDPKLADTVMTALNELTLSLETANSALTLRE